MGITFFKMLKAGFLGNSFINGRKVLKITTLALSDLKKLLEVTFGSENYNKAAFFELRIQRFVRARTKIYEKLESSVLK